MNSSDNSRSAQYTSRSLKGMNSRDPHLDLQNVVAVSTWRSIAAWNSSSRQTHSSCPCCAASCGGAGRGYISKSRSNRRGSDRSSRMSNHRSNIKMHSYVHGQTSQDSQPTFTHRQPKLSMHGREALQVDPGGKTPNRPPSVVDGHCYCYKLSTGLQRPQEQPPQQA